jgi:hypothetical protein
MVIGFAPLPATDAARASPFGENLPTRGGSVGSVSSEAEEVRRLRSLNLELVAKIRQARSELGSNESRVAEILDDALAKAR